VDQQEERINDLRKESWRIELDAFATRGLGGVEKAAVTAERNRPPLAVSPKQQPHHWPKPFSQKQQPARLPRALTPTMLSKGRVCSADHPGSLLLCQFLQVSFVLVL